VEAAGDASPSRMIFEQPGNQSHRPNSITGCHQKHQNPRPYPALRLIAFFFFCHAFPPLNRSRQFYQGNLWKVRFPLAAGDRAPFVRRIRRSYRPGALQREVLRLQWTSLRFERVGSPASSRTVPTFFRRYPLIVHYDPLVDHRPKPLSSRRSRAFLSTSNSGKKRRNTTGHLWPGSGLFLDAKFAPTPWPRYGVRLTGLSPGEGWWPSATAPPAYHVYMLARVFFPGFFPVYGRPARAAGAAPALTRRCSAGTQLSTGCSISHSVPATTFFDRRSTPMNRPAGGWHRIGADGGADPSFPILKRAQPAHLFISHTTTWADAGFFQTYEIVWSRPASAFFFSRRSRRRCDNGSLNQDSRAEPKSPMTARH